MTTLADINQTLTVQNEMQEKTNKAIESLTKRFAAFLRVAKGDKLEDLESRREARRQNRASGFARGVSGFAKTAKENAGLISRILGGLALGAFVLQNDELRAAVMDFITTAGEGIATFFKSDEFREILGATFSAAGEVFTSLLGTVWETPGGKQMLAGLGIALAAIFGGPALIAAVAASLTASLLKLPFQVASTVTEIAGGGRGSVVEERGARAKAIAEQRRLAAERAKANAAQQRFSQNQKGFRPASVRPTYPAPDDFFKKRGRLPSLPGLGTLSRLLGPFSVALGAGTGLADKEAQQAGVEANERMALGIGQLVPGTLDTVQLLGTELLNQAVPVAGPGLGDTAAMMYDLFLKKIGLPGLPGVSAPTTTEAYREAAIPFLSEVGRQRAEARELELGSSDYFAPTTGLYGFGTTELSDDYMAYQQAKEMERSIQSKVPAIQQGMAGAGTGAPIVVPVTVPSSSGGASAGGPSAFVPNVANAGESYHKNFGLTGENVVFGLSRVLPLN